MQSQIFQGILRWFAGFCTAHNKMAAMKKSIWSNIIKMKLTEEKRYRNYFLRGFSADMRLNV